MRPRPAVGAGLAPVPSPLRLFGLEDRRLDLVLTAAAILLLGFLRFAYLANGPWELDEVAFARALLDFDMMAYFPHPPGYPGWIAIGHLLKPFAPEPLVALQWASASFSVLALWPLAALGRKVASPAVAATAALVVLLAPGPALFAVRGFSSTAAAVLALSAAAVAVSGDEQWRPTAFTALMAAAFLVRPHLLPPLAVLWLGLALSVRPRRRLVPGLLVALLMGGASLAGLAIVEGGVGRLLGLVLHHAQRHFSRLGANVGSYPDLGLTKGLGGAVMAGVLLGAAAVGLVVWWRRVSPRSAALWAAVLMVAVFQLVWLQNRTYCRYAVPVQMALAPLVAGAAALAPPALGWAAVIGAGSWMGVQSWPLLAEQHTAQLPAWRAIQAAAAAAEQRDMTVVVGSELHLFASYLWLREQERGHHMPRRVLTPWNPEPWRGVDRPWLVATVHRNLYPDPLAGGELRWGGISPRLARLAQGRFLEAWLIGAPPLPVAGWWPAEDDPSGGRFMWGGSRCELLLPPLPPDMTVALELRPALGPAPVSVVANGHQVAELAGSSEGRWLWLGPAHMHHDAVNLLTMVRAAGYPPGAADRRPLAVQLHGLGVRGPSLPWSVAMVGPEAAWALGARIQGSYPPERFADGLWGTWLEPEARLLLPAGRGRLFVELSAPRPSPPRTVLSLDGTAVAGPLALTSAPLEVAVDLGAGDSAVGVVSLGVSSVPYVPAAAGGGGDERRLGVVLHRIRFEPERYPSWARPLSDEGTGGSGVEWRPDDLDGTGPGT